MRAELVELCASVDRNPLQVVGRAEALLAALRAESRSDDAARAATLLARAHRDLRNVESAEQAIDEALRLARPLGGDICADAHLVAASIATFRRGSGATMSHLVEADRLGSVDTRRRVAIQRAVLARREGRLDEALRLFADAIDKLRDADDDVRLARVVSNRAIVRILRGDVVGAIDDLGEALLLFERSDQEFAVTIVMQNLAWAQVNLGDIPAALRLLDEVDRRLAGHGYRGEDAAISRAEAMMVAGLFDDAARVANDAADRLRTHGVNADVGEALLLVAEASRLAGRPSREPAAEALLTFDRLGLNGLADAARLEVMRSAVIDGAATSDTAAEAEMIATKLGAAGHVRSEVDAWSLAATTSLWCGDLDRARAAADRCRDLAAAVPFVEHRLAAAHACAVVAAADGERDRALATIAETLDEFDAYRAAIGSPDARSSSALHADAIRRLGADLVVVTADEKAVLAWSERRRSSVRPWAASCRTEADEAVTELRSVLAELREAETTTPASGRTTTDLVARRRELEIAVRDRLLLRGSDDDGVAADGVVVGFDHEIGVSIDIHGTRVMAVVVHRDTMRLVDLCDADELSSVVKAVSALLARCARTGSATTWRRLGAGVERLDDLAITPLELGPGPVVMTMPHELQAGPWFMTAGLRDRAVSMAPSLTSPTAEPGAREAPHTVSAFAGPRLGLAEREAHLIADLHGGDVFVGERAEATALSAAMAAHDIVHIAAHTRVRRDNPMWSTIELSGGPLLLHELVGHRVSSRVVMLSSCESATSAGPAGAAMPGFATVLLESGARSVIATISALPDDDSTLASVGTVHRRLRAGDSVAHSLAVMRRDHPDSVAAHAFGAWTRR